MTASVSRWRPGALDRLVGVELHPHALDALPIDLPAGLTAVDAARLELGGAQLALPAALTFPADGADDVQHLLLSAVEVDGVTRWCLVGVATLDGDRLRVAPDVAPDLPAPWVTGDGVYVLVRPEPEAWMLLSGVVLDVGGTPIARACQVTASGGLVQLTATDGTWAVAAPAPAANLLAEDLELRNSGGVSVTASAGEHLADVDIQLLVVAPEVVATSPEAGANGQAATVPVTIDLSEPLNPATVDADTLTVEVIVGTAAPQAWPGTLELSGDGTRLTWSPQAPYPSAAQVEVTLDGGVRDLQGYTLVGGEHTFLFGIERFLLPGEVDASKIRLYAPGHDPAQPDLTVVEGLAGAVPGDIWMYVEDVDHQTDTTTIQASQDGSFVITLEPWDPAVQRGVEVGDRLLLHLLDTDDPDEDLGVVPLRPWLLPDGRGAWFTSEGGTFETVDGIHVAAPYGAFPNGGSVHVTPRPRERGHPC